MAGGTKPAGYMSGKRGYGRPYDEPGTGATMLLLVLQARAKQYDGQPSGASYTFGRAMSAVAQMSGARAGYDQTRKDLLSAWAPHTPPAYERTNLEIKRTKARAQVAQHASSAIDALIDWAAQMKRRADSHRPQLTPAERKDAEERLSRFRPEEWAPGSVASQRIRIVQAALQTGDRALADVALFNPHLDTIMARAKLPEALFDHPDRDAARTQDAVWSAEQARFTNDLCGADAAADLARWRDAEQDVKQFVQIIHQEADRMVNGESWGE
jgi:hypothetical protein